MKKFFVLTLIVITSITIIAANVLIPVGPTVFAFVGLLEGKITSEIPLKIDFWRSLDQVNAQLIAGTADVVVLPVSIGASLYSKGLGLKLGGVFLWGGFYIVSKEPLSSVDQLSSKEIYTPQGKGQTGDILIRMLISKYNLQNVSIKYLAQTEIVPLMSAGKASIAVLPEPFVTMALKSAGAQIAFDLQKLWFEMTELSEEVPITGIFISTKVEPSQAVKILQAISSSLKYALENKNEACQLSAKYLGGIGQDVLLQSLSRTKYEYRSAKESKQAVLTYLKIVTEIEPSVLGKLPDDDFFAY
ncbi:ABC transporter substrate-binding protein [Pseudothermotoga thermarum]|uniref:Putative sulfonate transport system substrate-binding protein n=1 Tax=Pseudothermotoga thermarum DSM 5069 TaxID=688269 RepID=F7YU97_9THEM|nr:MqnA/MqnD/SBP family protein [Pseudothermotoga thermarum]AEH50199.1 putative sulfonate transport system substrate-binding protein [Pseudothermotoga thermarum DSM 5069]